MLKQLLEKLVCRPKPEKYKEMKAFEEDFDDMPDGAFFALAEEMGIDYDDWYEMAEYESGL